MDSQGSEVSLGLAVGISDTNALFASDAANDEIYQINGISNLSTATVAAATYTFPSTETVYGLKFSSTDQLYIHKSSDDTGLFYLFTTNRSAEASVDFPIFTTTAVADNAVLFGTASVDFPIFEVEAIADNFVLSASANVEFPLFTTSAIAETTYPGGNGMLESSLPALILTTTAGTSGVGDSELPVLTLEAAGDAGFLANADNLTPKLRLVASGGPTDAALLTFAALSIEGLGFQTPVAAARLTLPSLTLTAIATAALTAQFEAWCMNMRNFGVTEYTDYEFTSFARLDGKLYGTTSEGIFEITGTNDNGEDIESVIESGIAIYSGEPREANDISSRKKYSHGSYANLRCTGEFAVSVKIDEQDERIYTIDATNDHDGIHRRRIKIAKGVNGYNWQFGFRNIQGSDFHLKEFVNIPVISKRRV
jgi:hypothetical protein